MSKCIAYNMKDVLEAWKHMKCEVVEDYGRKAYGHYLFVWDEGGRILLRCKNCGGYVLRQDSEFHGMEDDDYYTDFFFVDSPEEADELNRKYSGEEIEFEYSDRFLMYDNGMLKWSRKF